MSTRSPRRKTGRFRGVAAEERQAQRRRMLVEAGVELFGRRGFHAVTVRDLCQAAKLTERYFYESFANREALFAAVYDHLTGQLRDALMRALLPAPRETGAMARAALRVLFTSFRDDPRLMRILFVDVFTVSDDVDRMSRRVTQGFAEMVQSLVETLYPGEHRPGLDPRLLAHGLVGACMNMVMHWAFGGFREPVEALVDNGAALFEALGAYVPARSATAPAPRRGRAPA